MIIIQVDDFDASKSKVSESKIDIVWETDLPEAKAMHLHPKQMGGAILSLDWMNPKESWKWAGPNWEDHISGPISGIDGVEIQSDNPRSMFEGWLEVLGNPNSDNETCTIHLDNTWLKFVVDEDNRGSGVSTFSLKTNDRESIMKRAEGLSFIKDGSIYLGGMKFNLV